MRPAVDAVTTEQVNEVAKRRLARDKRTTGWFQPVERRE
jgi:predicted Zn-dependent peptidase